MFRKSILFLGLLLLVSPFAYAEENYSISGQVAFSGHENIFVSIYTIEGFPNYKKSLPSPPFFQKIEPNPEQVKVGKVSFTFSKIPKGSYSIVAFQDLDDNEKLSCDTWGQIQEPNCYYKEPSEIGLGTPSWDNVKFELVKDINEIIMKLD